MYFETSDNGNEWFEWRHRTGGATTTWMKLINDGLYVKKSDELKKVILEGDSRLTDSRPASDVSSWAKATTKPSYNWNEIGNKPDTFSPSAHNHSASEITSGTLLISRGGTGNTDNTAAKLSTTATKTTVNECYDDQKAVIYHLNGNNTGNSGANYAGTANTYGFPTNNNANSLLWIGHHQGNYGHQIGFSSNGRLYSRYISSGNFPATANGVSWEKVLFRSDFSDWALASTKPSYSWSEITGTPSIPTTLPASGGNADTLKWLGNHTEAASSTTGS